MVNKKSVLTGQSPLFFEENEMSTHELIYFVLLNKNIFTNSISLDLALL